MDWRGGMLKAQALTAGDVDVVGRRRLKVCVSLHAQRRCNAFHL